jgi:hypothetical protein
VTAIAIEFTDNGAAFAAELAAFARPSVERALVKHVVGTMLVVASPVTEDRTFNAVFRVSVSVARDT